MSNSPYYNLLIKNLPGRWSTRQFIITPDELRRWFDTLVAA